MKILRCCVAIAIALAAFAADAAREGFVFKGRVDFLEPGREYDAEFLFYVGDSESPSYGRRAHIRTTADRVVNFVVSDALDEMAEPPISDAYRSRYADFILDCAKVSGDVNVELRVDVGNGVKKSSRRQRVAPVPFANRVLTASGSIGDFTATDGKLTFRTIDCGRLNVASADSSLSSLSCGGGAELRGDVSVHGRLSLSSGHGVTVDGEVKVSGEQARISCDSELPVGAIIAWTGKDLPSGPEWNGVWALCDGKDGRPNLCDKFIVGASDHPDYANGHEGGVAEVTISESTYPRHTHSFSLRYPKYTTFGINDLFSRDDDVWGGGTVGYTTTTGSSSGSGKAHNNIPPYYSVVFIQRVR